MVSTGLACPTGEVSVGPPTHQRRAGLPTSARCTPHQGGRNGFFDQGHHERKDPTRFAVEQPDLQSEIEVCDSERLKARRL